MTHSTNPYSAPNVENSSRQTKKRWSLLFLLPIANVGVWILATQFTAYTGLYFDLFLTQLSMALTPIVLLIGVVYAPVRHRIKPEFRFDFYTPFITAFTIPVIYILYCSGIRY